jgi:hypothetical protein
MINFTPEEISSLVDLVESQSHLTQLGLSNNPTLGSSGICILMKSTLFAERSQPSLVTGLYLSSCDAKADGAAAVSEHLASPFSNVIRCGFNFNQCGDAGAIHFSRALQAPSRNILRVLGLTGNEITDVGAEALAEALLASQAAPLHRLFVGDNAITDRGCLALVTLIRRCPTLKRLGLAGNRIGVEGLTAVAEAAENSSTLERVCVYGNPGLENEELKSRLLRATNINIYDAKQR